MPQARPRNKNAAKNRQQNPSAGRNEPAGRAGGKNAAKFQQKGASPRGQRGMQGARSQRVNNQRNQNNLPAQQRERDEYGSVRGREFTNSYESDSDQPRVSRGQESFGGYDKQSESSGRGRKSNRGGQSQSRSAQSRKPQSRKSQSRGGRTSQGGGNSGRGNDGGQTRSRSRASGYNYQEEDFEEGGQNESTNRRGSGRQNRSQTYQRQGSERGQQYDGDDYQPSGRQSGRRGSQGRSEGRVSGGGSRFDEGREFDVGPRGTTPRGGQYDRESMEEQGGYGPPERQRNFQNTDGWGNRSGRGQYQYEAEGDWERAGPGNHQGGDFQGGRSHRARGDVNYYGASQYSQGGGRGDNSDDGPNWNQRYGNVNRVPGGVEDEEFSESRESNDRPMRQGRGNRDGQGGFENARGEYSNFNAGRRPRDEDSELNDYTDARLGSNARRGNSGSSGRSMQFKTGSRKSVSNRTAGKNRAGNKNASSGNRSDGNRSKGSSGRRQKAARGNR